MSALPVTIIMIEDDEGHARLIEKNVRRAGVNNEILHFLDGTSALQHLETPETRGQGPLLVLDGAHTRESAASLVAAVRAAFPASTHPLVLVVAMAEDKDARQVLPRPYQCAGRGAVHAGRL